jgi:hypothetical protein
MENIVGSIVHTMLDVDSFQNKNGARWILADGRAAPAGSEYVRLVGPNVPDLRGVFLRGKNYDRSTTEGNADGDLPVGAYQKGEIASHSHSYIQMVFDNNVDGIDSTARYSFEHLNASRQPGVTGGTEVRPNCVTVNIFICVGETSAA